MEISEYIAVISTVISLTSLAVVVIELRHNRGQSKTSALIQIYDINRQLLSLGFSNPELFKIIGSGSESEEEYGRRYLQLWLNQMALIHHLNQRGLFTEPQWNSLRADIDYFLTIPKMREHWKAYRRYYPGDFQIFLDQTVKQIENTKKAGASENAPPEKQSA